METQRLVQLWKVSDQLAQKSGQRKCVLAVNGNQYTGEWENNKRAGVGHQVWVKKGMEYEGEWKNDMRHGKGSLWILDKSSPGELRIQYEGDWRVDKMHGNGKFYYEDGGYYEGEWRNNKREGQGEMQYANGDCYVGEWASDARHGQGVYTITNGNVYSGGWQNDKKEGKGFFVYKQHRQRYEGEWLGDTAKYGVLVDDGDAQKIPPCALADPEAVLQEQHRPIVITEQQ